MTQSAPLSVNWIYDLFRIGQEVASAESTDSARQQMLAHIVSGFGAHSGCLALTTEDGRSLRLVAGTKLPAHVIGSTCAFGDRILGWVAQEGQALLLNGDVSKDPRFRNLRARDESGIPMVALCWPLTVEARVIGVLSINRGQNQEPFTEEDLRRGGPIMNLVAIVIENALLQAEQKRSIAELSELNHRLEEAHSQLLQSEKLAAIGQLAAGVAHEINNPVGYVNSNLGTLQDYLEQLFALLAAYERALGDPAARAALDALKQRLDTAFVREDAASLVRESLEGLGRVRKIVQDLKEFSHVDRAEWQAADLHHGLDSTLNIVHNEIKYKAEVVREYGQLPAIECIPSQLNQVFMNLLVNAAQAIESRGTITVRTGTRGQEAFVEIRDTGKGMPAEVQKRIFDPFFTTKPVGQGTGLGLSLAYGIVQKHRGRIEVESAPGAGSAFRVWVPLRHPESEAA